jgi:hypothetical protein
MPRPAAFSRSDIQAIYSAEFQGAEIRIRVPETRFSQDGGQLFASGATFLRSWEVDSKRRARARSLPAEDRRRSEEAGPSERSSRMAPR